MEKTKQKYDCLIERKEGRKKPELFRQTIEISELKEGESFSWISNKTRITHTIKKIFKNTKKK